MEDFNDKVKVEMEDLEEKVMLKIEELKRRGEKNETEIILEDFNEKVMVEIEDLDVKVMLNIEELKRRREKYMDKDDPFVKKIWRLLIYCHLKIDRHVRSLLKVCVREEERRQEEKLKKMFRQFMQKLNRRFQLIMEDLERQQRVQIKELERRFKLEMNHFKRRNIIIHGFRSIGAGASNDEMTFGKKMVDENYTFPWQLIKFMKFTGTIMVIMLYLPCAGGAVLGDGQYKHQAVPDIFLNTSQPVRHCPSSTEEMEIKSDQLCKTCVEDGCEYHCMRESSKTKLMEFCAKPKRFFDYCPEYDPVDQTIQKDTSSWCKPSLPRRHYNSSEIFFCDPKSCLKLEDPAAQTGTTMLTMLMNETTEWNRGEFQETSTLKKYITLFVATVTAIVVFAIMFFIYRMYKRGTLGHPRNMAEEIHQNGYENGIPLM